MHGIQVVLDAVADMRRGRLHGIAGKVSVPGSGLNLCMAQQLSDHRQAFAECQRARGKDVPEVMNSHILKFRARPTEAGAKDAGGR